MDTVTLINIHDDAVRALQLIDNITPISYNSCEPTATNNKNIDSRGPYKFSHWLLWSRDAHGDLGVVARPSLGRPYYYATFTDAHAYWTTSTLSLFVQRAEVLKTK